MKPIKYINSEQTNQVLSNFAITLALVEIIVIITFAIFVRMDTSTSDPLQQQRSTALINTNVMLLIGFAYLMTSLKHNNLTVIIYTLILNAFVLQIYLLVQYFWAQIFKGFKLEYYIKINQKLLMKGCYCIASSLISMAAVVGRINPTDLIKLAIVHAAGYALNEQIVYTALGAFDAGGANTVFIFGTYFGLASSFVLAKHTHPNLRPEKTYYSNVLSMLGCLFLWIFWPSFNFAANAQTTFQRSQIVVNTYCALAGSTIAALIVTSNHGRGIIVEDISHATLVGGVAIACSCGILYIPAVAIGIGFLAGIISTNALHYFSKKLERSLKIVDLHGVHSTFGIPAIIGTLACAIIIVIYGSNYDQTIAKQYGSNNLFTADRNFMKQGGMQFVAILSSLGLSILFGLGAGKFIGLFYQQRQQNFYEDCTYFDRNLFLNSEDRQIRYQQPEQIKKGPFTSERIEKQQTVQHISPKKSSQRKSKKQIKPEKTGKH